MERAIEIICEKIEREKNRVIKTFDDEPELQVLNGRWGPYIAFNKQNFKIPKTIEPSSLTKEDCYKIINTAPEKKKSKK
jgi:DNA topoisomerase-1